MIIFKIICSNFKWLFFITIKYIQTKYYILIVISFQIVICKINTMFLSFIKTIDGWAVSVYVTEMRVTVDRIELETR